MSKKQKVNEGVPRRIGYEEALRDIAAPLEASRSSDLSTIKELMEYAQHNKGCCSLQIKGTATWRFANGRCTCGLSDLLTRLK